MRFKCDWSSDVCSSDLYTDTIKRENGAWKFAHRKLVFDGVKK